MAQYDIFKMVIGIIIVGGFMTTLGVMFWVPIPIENKMAVDIVLGALATMTVSIVSYLFGSSRGSKEKDAIIAQLKHNKPE